MQNKKLNWRKEGEVEKILIEIEQNNYNKQENKRKKSFYFYLFLFFWILEKKIFFNIFIEV